MLHELFLFIGGYICYASCLAAVGGGGLISKSSLLPLLGFTATGIKAGSWAAYWMAYYGGYVPAGGIFAFLQSIRAGGASLTSFGKVVKICDALCTADTASDYFGL